MSGVKLQTGAFAPDYGALLEFDALKTIDPMVYIGLKSFVSDSIPTSLMQRIVIIMSPFREHQNVCNVPFAVFATYVPGA